MCGIFGYVGKKKGVKLAIEGLKKLEYRGYDSAGLAGIRDNTLYYSKQQGKVALLAEEVERTQLDLNTVVAHTRWATHGEPSFDNAHPQFDEMYTLAVVHNGIIENFKELRRELERDGVTFRSATDTEVIAHLIRKKYTGDLLKALREAVSLLRGAFAIAVIHCNHPDAIAVACHDSPLVYGVGKGEMFVASDPQAFSEYTKEVVFLQKGEIGLVTSESWAVYTEQGVEVEKRVEALDISNEIMTKGNFEHYTLKEIFEQPITLQNALYARISEENGTAFFEELNFESNELLSVERILILACGTSWHAGYVAKYMIESMARIPVQIEISSEFRYKNPIVLPGTFVIAISQSGETADTLAAVRELKAKGAKILSLCNVYHSSLDRESDATLFLRAGPEIGVCSTKAFTSQVAILALFSLLLGRMRGMGRQDGLHFIHAMNKIPNQVKQILENAIEIEKIAKKFAHYENFFFLGRQYMFPVSLEGALKLKEISYINANGYPAGEMKHGPIALISPECPTVALCCNGLTYDKILSNLMEVKARKGPIIAIAFESQKGVEEIADEVFRIPDTIDSLATIPVSVVTQLLAYYIARERGAEIDQPRNLAKSVTVE